VNAGGSIDSIPVGGETEVEINYNFKVIDHSPDDVLGSSGNIIKKNMTVDIFRDYTYTRKAGIGFILGGGVVHSVKKAGKLASLDFFVCCQS
jgi:hypothetical protein